MWHTAALEQCCRGGLSGTALALYQDDAVVGHLYHLQDDLACRDLDGADLLGMLQVHKVVGVLHCMAQTVSMLGNSQVVGYLLCR